MKWRLLAFMIIAMLLGSRLSAQRVTLSVKEASLESVFKIIEKQTGFFFTYTTEELASAKKVTIDVTNASLAEVLKLCFKDQSLTYEVVDKSIVVKRLLVTPQTNTLVNSATLTISGTVWDEQDKTVLEGAIVVIENSSVGVLTDDEGEFFLNNVKPNDVIVVSYVGYASQRITIKSSVNDLSIKLKRTSIKLESLVVNTGLYRRPIGNFTGAASTMSGEELKMVNSASVVKAIAAMDPSFRIVENNTMGSNPNSLPVIQLRGQNNLPVNTQNALTTVTTPTDILAQQIADQQSVVMSGDIMSSYVSNPNQPLIIIDGFQSSLQRLYDMDINLIERITLLKDAAASVAYGSKAANGVIVVETKKPVSGRLQLSYAMNVNTQIVDLSSYHLLDAEGLLQAQKFSGVYTDPANHSNDIALQQWYDYRLYKIRSGVNTYWLSQPVRTGVGTSHSVMLSGGNNAVRFSLNASYNNVVGVMKESGRNAYSVIGVIGYNTGSFRFSNSMNISYGLANNSKWGNFADYASQFPYFRKNDSAGNVIKVFEPSNTVLGIPIINPSGVLTNTMYNSTLNVKDYSYYWSFNDMTTVEWIINQRLRLTGGLNISNQLPGADKYLPADHTIFLNSGTSSGFTDLGSYTQTRGKSNSLDGRISLDYNKRTNHHSLYISLGASAQQTASNATTIQVTGIPNDNLSQLGMANGYQNSSKPSASMNNTRSMSLYSSVSYNYLERYTGEVTVNASGSSQFGANNRLAPFFAYGAGWNIDKERFFGLHKQIQQLRLKLSYGITGNQNFAAAMAQPIYQYNLQNNYRLQLGSTLQAYANPDLKWQQTQKWNAILLMSLLDSRLNINLTGYIENTDNLILPIGVNPSTGFTSYQDNLGATQNKGYEVAISAVIIKNREKNIFWTVSFNTGHNINVIKSLSPAIDALNKAYDASTSQTAPLPRYQVGQSMSKIWAVKSLGIDPATGNEVYEKLDGSRTFTWSAVDKQPIGESISKFKGSIASNLTYKGFVFNIILGFEYGGQMYNQTLVDRVENVDLRYYNADSRVLTERWKQPGDHTFFKALALNSNGSSKTNATSRFVQDNNYINASSMTVGYTFPSNLKWVRTLHLSTPRLFITQNDVFRLSTIKLERGTSYPFSRTFSFGLATTF